MNWIAQQIANRLPGRIVYWCLMRAYYHAQYRRMEKYGEWRDVDLAAVVEEWVAR